MSSRIFGLFETWWLLCTDYAIIGLKFFTEANSRAVLALDLMIQKWSDGRVTKNCDFFSLII